jgi:hypothetical protein
MIGTMSTADAAVQAARTSARRARGVRATDGCGCAGRGRVCRATAAPGCLPAGRRTCPANRGIAAADCLPARPRTPTRSWKCAAAPCRRKSGLPSSAYSEACSGEWPKPVITRQLNADRDALAVLQPGVGSGTPAPATDSNCGGCASARAWPGRPGRGAGNAESPTARPRPAGRPPSCARSRTRRRVVQNGASKRSHSQPDRPTWSGWQWVANTRSSGLAIHRAGNHLLPGGAGGVGRHAAIDQRIALRGLRARRPAATN